MKEVYVCAKCGFVSTIHAEFVRFGEKHFCTSCAYDECRKEAEIDGAKNTEQPNQPNTNPEE